MVGPALLLVIGAVFLVAAGVLRLILGPNRYEEPAPGVGATNRFTSTETDTTENIAPAALEPVAGGRFGWAPLTVFAGLFAVCAVCLALLPPGINPRSPAFQRPLLEVLADPFAARTVGLLVLGIGSFLLFPVVAIWADPVRGIAAPWAPRGRVWAAGGRPWTGFPLAIAVVGAVGAVAWFSVTAGLLAAVIGYVIGFGWLQRKWIVVDDVGVVWSGFRFRWDQVTAWHVVFHPATGGEDGSGECYELVVELATGAKLSRDDSWPPRRLSDFFAQHVPEKRADETPAAHAGASW